jgi:hypothetical protein
MVRIKRISQLQAYLLFTSFNSRYLLKMKKTLLKFLGAVLVITIVGSCKPNLTVPTASKGSMDPTRFVAIGNSITSGYADGALYYQGQQNSFVNLMAGQFKLVGGGSFNQPYVDPSSIGVGASGNAPFKLGYSTDCLGVTSLAPIPAATSGDLSILSTSVATSGPFNNMGVPGAKVITAVAPGYGNALLGPGNYNPFFYRMASNMTTASMLSDAAAQNPTFFSCFLGNNDVLAYAMAGATSDFITPSAGSVGAGFDASLNQVINTLTANGAKGVIANIPDVTSLPYFTTIPYNGLALNATNANLLNLVYNARGDTFSVGNNPFLIQDTANPWHVRLMHSDELILLDAPLDSIKCHGMGSYSGGIPSKYVLTRVEIQTIQTAISAFNATIRSVATSKGLAFVDVNAFMKSAQKGIIYNGVTLSTAFVTGGAWSLDGIHLNPVGQALLANEFIKSINATYSSTIPQVDVTKYRGVIFP